MLLRRHFRLQLLTIALTAALGTPLDAQHTATIFVNAGERLGPVNRLVFGQNLEAGDNARIFSSDTTDLDLIQKGEGTWDPLRRSPVPEVVNESRSVKMSVLRYPGGCLTHNFDWRKSVGPDAKKDGWLFGVDEYLTLCHAIGAIPLITISDYALPSDQMPANAAQLVEYLNSPADTAHPLALKRKEWGHPTPYNVEWFELGNESMHGNHRVTPHRQYSAEEYVAYANATAAAMRKVDPKIKIGIVTVPGPGTDVDCEWNRTVVRGAGANADFVVIHIYAPQGPKTGVPEELRMQSMMVAPQHIEERLTKYHEMIQKQLGHDLPLAITEFNGGLDQSGSPYRFSYGDALECADLLRVFLKPELKVALANYWNFVNGYFGMLRTSIQSPDGEPVVEEPVYQFYKMWAQHFGAQLVPMELQSRKAEFAGLGSEEAARGSVPVAKRQLGEFDLNQYSSAMDALWARLLDVQIQRQNTDFTIRFQHLNRSIYPALAHIPRPDRESPSPLEFTVSFDAIYKPDPGSEAPPMGIGLVDSRGWKTTGSGIGVDDISTSWKHFEGTYRLTAQTSGVDLTARLIAEGRNASGTLLIHNLKVAATAPAHSPAYPLLTGAASLSSDGSKLYLVVFNKSAEDSIPTAMKITGFSPKAARYWELNGRSLESREGVSETVTGAAVRLGDRTTATHSFPAHSMTAIEFSLER